jgi:NAD(P)-dependent dehydrogenase (short-subunit alcohol dehydrogenase family)
MSAVRVLVVGARKGSLGEALAVTAERAGYAVYTAGIHDEQIELDLLPTGSGMPKLMTTLGSLQPTHIVCTVGINMPEPAVKEDVFDWYRWHYETNAIAPMRLLDGWLRCGQANLMPSYGHYVAISSNSAHIPRTRSAAYCASKAALSMALRVKAREVAGRPIIYGYEPGLLEDTPMTAQSTKDFDGSLTRMKPGALARGIDPIDLAGFIVGNLQHDGLALNGSILRYSADEL